jgi:hypothetical protein
MFQNRTLPIYQLEAVMNLDNVYGMDEIIGDPIHAFGPPEQEQQPSKQSFNWMWLLLLLLVPLVVFLIYTFKR